MINKKKEKCNLFLFFYYFSFMFSCFDMPSWDLLKWWISELMLILLLLLISRLINRSGLRIPFKSSQPSSFIFIFNICIFSYFYLSIYIICLSVCLFFVGPSVSNRRQNGRTDRAQIVRCTSNGPREGLFNIKIGKQLEFFLIKPIILLFLLFYILFYTLIFFFTCEHFFIL